MDRTLLLVRYHDGAAKPNWGGRSTTLGLARLLAALPDSRLAEPINGRVITAGFSEFGLLDKLSIRMMYRRQVARRAYYPTRPFSRLDDHARRFLAASSPDLLVQTRSALLGADEVWMNGEGDFILGSSGTLWRSLILMRAAQMSGKPVHLVNSILSSPNGRPTDRSVIDAVGVVLGDAATVTYRDARSLELHRSLYPRIDADWLPDALFTWAPDARAVVESRAAGATFGPATERLSPAIQDRLGRSRPYVLISGGSAGSDTRPHHDVATLIERLRSVGQEAILVATDSKDSWLGEVAAECGCEYVPADIPMISALTLLSGASCLVSGRYHPTILAALVGTPAIVMNSNSHKNESLMRTLGEPDDRAREETYFGEDGFDVAAILPRIEELVAEGPDSDGLLGRANRVYESLIDRAPGVLTAGRTGPAA
jgi:Polysaccharide pyruvyl transferase